LTAKACSTATSPVETERAMMRVPTRWSSSPTTPRSAGRLAFLCEPSAGRADRGPRRNGEQRRLIETRPRLVVAGEEEKNGGEGFPSGTATQPIERARVDGASRPERVVGRNGHAAANGARRRRSWWRTSARTVTSRRPTWRNCSAQATLRPMKGLYQDGEFAAEESLTLIGPRQRMITNVRILGPCRVTRRWSRRSRTASPGIDLPVRARRPRDSRLLADGTGRHDSAPKALFVPSGTFMGPRDAAHYGVKHGDRMNLRIVSSCPTVLEGLLCRVDVGTSWKCISTPTRATPATHRRAASSCSSNTDILPLPRVHDDGESSRGFGMIETKGLVALIEV
jgi:propanediol utilization protein